VRSASARDQRAGAARSHADDWQGEREPPPAVAHGDGGASCPGPPSAAPVRWREGRPKFARAKGRRGQAGQGLQRARIQGLDQRAPLYHRVTARCALERQGEERRESPAEAGRARTPGVDFPPRSAGGAFGQISTAARTAVASQSSSPVASVVVGARAGSRQVLPGARSGVSPRRSWRRSCRERSSKAWGASRIVLRSR
jgi:hypothetical protein